MRRLALILPALALLLAPPAVHAAAPARPELVPGRLVVRYRADSEAARRLAGLALRPPRAGLAPAGADLATGAALEWLVPTRGLARAGAGAEPLRRTVRLSLPAGADPAVAARELGARADVEWAYPVRLIPLAAVPAVIPDDPSLEAQWHHAAIGSAAAWAQTTGDPGVVVGVIDTGIDLQQDDLIPNLWTNAAEADGLPGVDDDGNGYVDDLHGYDFTDVPEIDGAGDFTVRDGDPQDDVGHGTWVAGAACAAGNNGVGGAGVAYTSRFMALRAGFRPRNGLSLGYLAEDDAAAAIIYAVENGADILNLSFGDLVRAPILEDAVRFALDRGVLVVAAAGNAGTGQPFYPAAISGVLAVGASDRDGLRAAFSSYGNDVELLAPGVGIVTTELGGGVTSKSGTSLASPLVAGAAALLLSRHPDWSPGKIMATLLAGARAGAAGADLKGARLLHVGDAMGDEGRVSILLPGMEDGQGVDRRLLLRGSVQGGDVRGWRVLLRRAPGTPWRTLGQSAHAAAYEDTLADWDASAEPEGPATLRVEALGVDRLAGAHEVALRIDHTPPVITNVTVLPIVSGDGYGFRIACSTDEEALGVVRLGAADSLAAMAEIVGTEFHVLGLNGPFTPGQLLPAEIRMTNRANLSAGQPVEVRIPELGLPSQLVRHGGAPPLISLLPRVLDLNGDGIPEIVGEQLPAGGQSYGQVVAYAPQPPGAGESGFDLVWESSQTYLPQDVGDFDGDGRPDILGLALQETRVYAAGPGGAYPNRLSWRTTEAWPARFIPAAEGTGLEIVASRDDEIRIYGRSGSELALRQSLKNPTTGSNSITPFIVSGVFERGGPLCLATIDGDGELLVYRRGEDGHFTLLLTRQLGSDNPGLLAAGDIDGDGVDELALVSDVGTFPSPSDGLRDGYFRLQVFHVSAGGLDLLAQLGASGFFPGNPVALSAVDLDGDGSREIWWSAGRLLYRLYLDEGHLLLDRSWEGVTAARPAVWERPAAQGGSRLLYPGDIVAGAVTPGAWFGRSSAADADPQPLGLSVASATQRGGTVELELNWRGQAGVTLARTRLPGPGAPTEPELPRVLEGLTGGRLLDEGLENGASYRYTLVRPGSARVADSLTVVARPANPIRSITRTRGFVIAEWTSPLHALEGATVTVLTAAGAPDTQWPLYPTPDRDGRRLLIGLPTDLEDRALVLRVSRYLSDSNLPLRDEDSRLVVPAATETPRLILRQATAVEPTRLRLVLDPGAPRQPRPADFALTPERVPSRVEVTADGVELSFDTPLAAGAWSVRLLPGLTGPGGEPVQIGEGDAIAFRVGPVVYPNPARPGGSVRFEGVGPGVRVAVYDLAGRMIWEATTDAAGAATWGGVAGGDRAPGIYLYRVEGDRPVEGKLAVKG